MSKNLMFHFACLCLLLAAIVPLTGCDEDTKKNIAILGGALFSGIAQTQRAQKMYQRPDWKAEEYFDDPQVINLCNAIRKRDIALIDKLIADGADVNAKGKGNMTPLRWAFDQGRPWNSAPPLSKQNQPGVTEEWYAKEFDAVHLSIFTKLLDHGTDPNILFFGVAGQECITERVVSLRFPYFEAVMRNGGNPHLISNDGTRSTLVHLIAMRGGTDSSKRFQLLIDAGINLEQEDAEGRTSLVAAVYYGNYDLAIALIESGSDWMRASLGSPDFLAPIVASLARQDTPRTVNNAAYLNLIGLLEEKGADFDLERKIRRLGQIDLGRMNIGEGNLIREELRILHQQRHELYEKIQQEKTQQEQQAVVL